MKVDKLSSSFKKQAIFLDRDGVINKERKDYVKSIEEFQILNNIPKINMGARSANAPLTQSYDKGPDVPLIEATIGDFFDAIVAKYPEREALVVRHQNIRWTYKQLQEQVNKLASAIITACMGATSTSSRHAPARSSDTAPAQIWGGGVCVCERER